MAQEFFDEEKFQDRTQWMFDLLWQRYKIDQNPEWLKTMLAMNVFKNTPMPKEIADAILYHLDEHIYEGPKKRKHHERDQMVCTLYGLVYPEHVKTFNKSAIRDVAGNFPDLNEENVRAILRRKFDAQKHLPQ